MSTHLHPMLAIAACAAALACLSAQACSTVRQYNFQVGQRANMVGFAGWAT